MRETEFSQKNSAEAKDFHYFRMNKPNPEWWKTIANYIGGKFKFKLIYDMS